MFVGVNGDSICVNIYTTILSEANFIDIYVHVVHVQYCTLTLLQRDRSVMTRSSLWVTYSSSKTGKLVMAFRSIQKYINVFKVFHVKRKENSQKYFKNQLSILVNETYI